MKSFDEFITYKELLIKDLCSRLNTKLVCSIYRTDDEGIGYRDEVLHGYCKGDIWYEFYFREDCSIGIDNVSKIKPYLLPLSSMTEEQEREYNSLRDFVPTYHYEYGDIVEDTELYDNRDSIDYLIENHFDVYDLIPLGLAKDASGLNLY